jgi:hypothetical protein
LKLENLELFDPIPQEQHRVSPVTKHTQEREDKNQNLKTQAGFPRLTLPWFEQQEPKPTGKRPEHKESRQHEHTVPDQIANAQNKK